MSNMAVAKIFWEVRICLKSSNSEPLACRLFKAEIGRPPFFLLT